MIRPNEMAAPKADAAYPRHGLPTAPARQARCPPPPIRWFVPACRHDTLDPTGQLTL
jgi:hypothetical protein